MSMAELVFVVVCIGVMTISLWLAENLMEGGDR